VLSILSYTGLLAKLSITVMRVLESARQFATNPFKLLLHKWLVELLGEYSKVIYLISANLNGPTWGFESPYYELFKRLFVCTCYGDPFSGEQ
jgi:hypothetical protein